MHVIQPIRDERLPIFDGAASIEEPCNALPPVDEPRRVRDDYAATGLSLKAHPVSFLRPDLDKLGATQAGDLKDESRFPQGATVSVAGIVLVRQRPGTASGIVFITLEDETGVANLIVRPNVFERYRRAARHSRIMLCSGTIERQGMVVHLQVRRLQSAGAPGLAIHTKSRDFH